MPKSKSFLAHLKETTIDPATWLVRARDVFHPQSTALLEHAIAFLNQYTIDINTPFAESCLQHALAIANIILELNLDQETVAAALLLGAVKYAAIPLEKITEITDEQVSRLIRAVCDMDLIARIYHQAQNHEDNREDLERLRKMLLTLVTDIRVVILKLAEHLQQMRSLKKADNILRKHIAQEAMDIYAPLANRLGIGQIKWELEDLAFFHLQPTVYKSIATFLAERRINRENRIETVIQKLQSLLQQAHIPAEVLGRAKHIYSIYRKSQLKNLYYHEIYDYNAVRILVNTLEDCYTVLSLVHNHFEQVADEFDDYIANPKPNGYRSIHTTVTDLDDKILEIQIRTHAIHDEAELGIAAHWHYKEGIQQPATYEQKIAYLRQLIEWHQDVAKENIPATQKLSTPLFDRIYVFTPESNIIELPLGATPLDFAYHIHSELGHQCRGAKVNGCMVPFTHALKTGDRVEVLTGGKGPSRDWLNPELGYLKTSRARAKVNAWFRQLALQQYIETGKLMLERELPRDRKYDLGAICKQLNFKSEQSMLAALGHGSIRMAQITALMGKKDATPAWAPESLPDKKTRSISAGLNITGLHDFLTRIAGCCKPIPGDPIVGYITYGKGISIHRQDCINIKQVGIAHQPRLIELQWDSQAKGNYNADISILTQHSQEALGNVISTLANEKISIIKLTTHVSKDQDTLSMMMTIAIHDKGELAKIIALLTKLTSVISVKRFS